MHETNNIELEFQRNRPFTIGSQNINGISSKIVNHYPNGTITVLIKQDISPAEKTKLNQATQPAFWGSHSEFKYGLPIIQNVQTVLLNAHSEFENSQSELKNAQSELKNAQSEFKDAQSEFKDAQSELKDAQSVF